MLSFRDNVLAYTAAAAGAVVLLAYRGIVFLAERLNTTNDPK